MRKPMQMNVILAREFVLLFQLSDGAAAAVMPPLPYYVAASRSNVIPPPQYPDDLDDDDTDWDRLLWPCSTWLAASNPAMSHDNVSDFIYLHGLLLFLRLSSDKLQMYITHIVHADQIPQRCSDRIFSTGHITTWSMGVAPKICTLPPKSKKNTVLISCHFMIW